MNGNSSGSAPVQKSSPMKKALLAIVFVVILLAGGGASYFLMQQNQDLRQDASENCRTETFCAEESQRCLEWGPGPNNCLNWETYCSRFEDRWVCDDSPPPAPTPDPREQQCRNDGNEWCGSWCCGNNKRCGTNPNECIDIISPEQNCINNRGHWCAAISTCCSGSNQCGTTEGECIEGGGPGLEEGVFNCGDSTYDTRQGEHCCANTSVCSQGQLCTVSTGQCRNNDTVYDGTHNACLNEPGRQCTSIDGVDFCCGVGATCSNNSCVDGDGNIVSGVEPANVSCTGGNISGSTFTATCTCNETTESCPVFVQWFGCSGSGGGACTSSSSDHIPGSEGQNVVTLNPGQTRQVSISFSPPSCGRVQADAGSAAGGWTGDTESYGGASCDGTGGGSKFTCNNQYQCVEDPKGQYSTFASCDSACNPPVNPPPTDKYSCNTSNYQCAVDPNGTYSSMGSCEDACVRPEDPKYTCTDGYQCIQAEGGEFSSLPGCQAECVEPEEPKAQCAEACTADSECANPYVCHLNKCAPPICKTNNYPWNTCTAQPGQTCTYCDAASCSVKTISETELACGATTCKSDANCAGSLKCYKATATAQTGICLSQQCIDAKAYTISNSCTPAGAGTSCQYCDANCTVKTVEEPAVGCAATCTSDTQCQGSLVCGAQGKCVSAQCKTANVALATSCTPNYGASCTYCGQSSCDLITIKGPYCGDGIRNGTEECDDGNTTNGDGCNQYCRIERSTVTPTPTPVAGAACNQSCVNNADCANASYICYTGADRQGVCRLDSNPTDANCQPAQGQPTLPATLPDTGIDSIASWLRAGLAVMGLGAVLLYIL